MNDKETNINQKIPSDAGQFEKLMKNILGKSFDFVIDRFKTEHGEAVVLFIDGMVNKDLVNRDIIKPLKDKCYDGDIEKALKSTIEKLKDIKSVVEKVLEGNAVVMQDNGNIAYALEFKQWDRRAVSEPDAESVTRGPKEGFTENIQTNTSLMRRKLRTPNLVIEKIKVGKQTNTLVALVYLEDIVNRDVLNTVKERIEKIDVDNILETGQIEQYIEENPYSLISGMGLTQKPDKCASKILEGRVAVMVDGTPHALYMPEMFIESLHTSEDDYSRVLYANFIRILRFFGLIISVILPGLSLAILTYSLEMLPYVFLSSFISASEKTPLPEWAEIFFLILMFELIKEASTRLPKTVGNAVTFVGALIIGEAAVNAGIVGAPTVIIVALTAVSSLMVSNLNEFVTVYRFVFLILGATMGLIGISTGIMILLIHLISTDSFGIPVLSSFNRRGMQDNVMRYPLRKIFLRPTMTKNNVRRKSMGEN